jgi:hypothetical protein
MKKTNLLKAAAAAALITVMVGCAKPATSSSSSAAPAPSSEPAVSSSVPEDPALTAAKEAVKQLDYSTQSIPGLGTRTFGLITEIKYSTAYDFTVSYTATQVTPYVGASISIFKDADLYPKAPLECTIVAPVKDSANTASFVAHKLTASLSLAGKVVYTKDFNLRSDVITPVAIKDLSEGKVLTGAVVRFYGTVTGFYDGAKFGSSNGIWVTDGDYGTMVYHYYETAPAIGTIVRVDAINSPYSGVNELVPFDFETFGTNVKNAPKGYTDMACTAPTTLTIAEAHTFTLTDINRPVKVTGTVSKIDKLTYGNLGITLTVGTGSVYVYVDSRINADAVTALKALAVGANTSIAGWVGLSNLGAYRVVNPSIAA